METTLEEILLEESAGSLEEILEKYGILDLIYSDLDDTGGGLSGITGERAG